MFRWRASDSALSHELAGASYCFVYSTTVPLESWMEIDRQSFEMTIEL